MAAISILTGSILFIRHASAGISVWRLAPRPADESDLNAPALDEQSGEPGIKDMSA
jgi:hypothetical protein